MREVKLLEDRGDLILAYSLVYDNYVKEGYIDSNPLGLRIREDFEMGENIFTFGGFREGELVGVASVILDSEVGLPSDESHDLSGFRGGGVICEIGNLVMGNDLRLLKLLFFELYHFVISHRVDLVWVVVSPEHVDYFRRFGFGEVGEEHRYENGDIVQGMVANVGEKPPF